MYSYKMQAVPLCSHFTGFLTEYQMFVSTFMAQQYGQSALQSTVRGKLLVAEKVFRQRSEPPGLRHRCGVL